jgi:hypothetical protein
VKSDSGEPKADNIVCHWGNIVCHWGGMLQSCTYTLCYTFDLVHLQVKRTNYLPINLGRYLHNNFLAPLPGNV